MFEGGWLQADHERVMSGAAIYILCTADIPDHCQIQTLRHYSRAKDEGGKDGEFDIWKILEDK